MAEYTENLGLLKKDPVADAKDTFNIQTMLNDNWDKVDAAVGNMSRCEAGIYTGTGEGAAHTFTQPPQAVFVHRSIGEAAVNQTSWQITPVFSLRHDTYNWVPCDGVSLVGTTLSGDELNVEGRTYYYIAWF